MAEILIILRLPRKDLPGSTSLPRLHPVHLHLREAVEAAVLEAVVAEAAEVAREAGHREVTKRFY